MLVRNSIFFVDSDRDAHFTDSLVGGASEYEDIRFGSRGGGYPNTASPAGGLTTGEARSFITSLRLNTATGHTFTVAFYSRDVNHQRLGATPYIGALIGKVTLTSHWRTATEYVYATDGLSIPYIDEDNSGELHVGLHNDSTYTKAATGAALPLNHPTPQFVQMRVGVISAA